MAHAKILPKLYFFVFLFGCVHSHPVLEPTTASNFRSKIKFEESSSTFSSGSRKDKSKRCFPPADSPICEQRFRDPAIYEKGNPLNIKGFTLSTSDRSPSIPESTEELAHLAIAEFTLQLGFKYFIAYSIFTTGSCRTTYSTSSSGSVVGNMYIGSSRLNETPSCLGTLNIRFIVFNDYEDIKSGVFENAEDATGAFPFGWLYDSNLFTGHLSIEDRVKYIKTPARPWKSYFIASETAEAIRSKHKVKPFSSYKYDPPTVYDNEPSTIDKLRKYQE